MKQESAFFRMLKVLGWAFGLALGGFLYSLCICGACTTGYFMGLGTALFIFSITVFGGVVMYLE
jgi:hypothetical protein